MTWLKEVKKLDAVFSRYIRLSRADENGIATCITCGCKKPWKEQQCGHFMSRSHYSVRFDELNCDVQCVKCNMFRQGESYIFSLRLDEKHGEGTAEMLHQKSKQSQKIPKEELIEMRKEYQKKFDGLH